MAISQLPQAPYRQDKKIFPTPIIGDVLFSEVRDCTRIEIPEYGSPHPNSNKWPDHKLVYVKSVDIERDGIFEFFYAAERANQDLYNYSSGYRNVVGNAGGREFQVVQRSYVTLRESFQPADIEFGALMPNVPEGKFDDVEYIFFDREQKQIQELELNSLFVAEVHTYVEKAVLDEQLSLSVEKQDPLPPKFRVSSPTTTTEELAEGQIITPTLTGDQLAATEDQINPNLKRKRTVSRSSTENTNSLSGKQVTNDLQVADVVETIVPDGTTIETSELTVDGSVESLGNGESIQRVITTTKLFTAKSYSTQRPDLTPEKFRVLSPTESTEENEAGTAEMPDLVAGELEATEQQVNVHVKRKRKTTRDTSILPQSLTQKATTNDKQIATVTETLQLGDTSETPTATLDIQSEVLGDGTYVVRRIEVPELFAAESHSVQKPDIVPERFRSQVPTTTEQSNKIGQAAPPSLAIGEIERSQQQINDFVYREQVTKRNITGEAELPEVQQAYVEGTIGKASEKFTSNPAIEKGLHVSESRATPVGDGKFVVQTVKVNAWPSLKSSEWDSVLNTHVGRTETFVTPPATFSESNTSYRAVNEDRSLKVTETEPTKALENYLLSFPVQIDIQLPNVLKHISVVWSDQYSEGSFSSDWDGWGQGTKSFSLSGSESGSATSSVSLKPELVIDIEQPWGSDLTATSYYFFIKNQSNAVSSAMLMARMSEILDSPVKKWPTFKPRSHSIILEGVSGAIKANVSAAASKSWQKDNGDSWDKTESKGQEYDLGTSLNAVTLPPTIHGAITLSNTSKQRTIKASANVGWYGNNFPTVVVNNSLEKSVYGNVTPSLLGATTPSSIPTSGLYIVKSSIEPYKWGWVRCAAVVIDASVLK